MARKRHFNQYSTTSEQDLVEDLVIESMKIYGVQAYYLPRTHVNLDRFYGEDASVFYDDAIEIEEVAPPRFVIVILFFFHHLVFLLASRLLVVVSSNLLLQSLY